MRNRIPLLHLYQWDGPSATYGYFIDPSKYLDLNKLRQHHVALARRPTGGGIVFHIWDLAFSFLIALLSSAIFTQYPRKLPVCQ